MVAKFVQLVDRPGRFYVVHEMFDKVRLLDGDTEFVVPRSQVLEAKHRAVRHQSFRSKTVHTNPHEFAMYRGFIDHLLARRAEVHLVLMACEGQEHRAFNKYLDLTGEELDPKLLQVCPRETSTGVKNWECLKGTVSFPALTDALIKVPGTLIARTTHRQAVRNLSLLWFLVAEHGFRIKGSVDVNQ